MTGHRRAAARTLASLFFFLYFLAGPAAADYRRSYLDGRRALERGDLERAIALLAEAARERPDEQARARLVGAIPEPYLPHHYLGLAHFRARSCPRALAEWKISARQGAVDQVPEARAEAGRHRAECEALARAEEAVADAGAAAEALDAALAGGGSAHRPPAHLVERRRAAEEALAGARSRLAAARGAWDFAQVAAAGEAARQAAAELAALRAELEREPAGARGESGGGDAVGGAGNDSRAVAGEDPPAAGGAAPEPPAQLLAGVQAYLDGDYRRALTRLDSAPAATARDRFVAALFRAASSHALYLLSGERDPGLLRAAESAAAACRRERPDWAPAPGDFSPRFVHFYAGLAQNRNTVETESVRAGRETSAARSSWVRPSTTPSPAARWNSSRLPRKRARRVSAGPV